MITNIKIIDNGQERYQLEPSSLVLGRMYDNNADFIRVVKPESEQDSLCIMIVTYMDTVIDHIVIDTESIPIRNNISQYESVRIGFSFTRADGYVKNSGTKKFSFLEAQKPDGFVAVESEQYGSIDTLIKNGFAKCEKDGNYLNFYNVAGDIISKINFGTFFQQPSDMAQDDENEVSFIKNKSTRYLTNEGEDGTSPYATQDFVNKNGGKIDNINFNGNPLPIEEKTVNIDIASSYYNKNSIDSIVADIYSKISGIPKFSIEVVDNLPIENIKTGVVYLLKSNNPETSNLYTEYIFVNAAWECLGSQNLDLTEYVKSSELSNYTPTSDLINIYASKLYVMTAIADASESLATTALKDVLNGNYLMHLDIDGIPTDLRVKIKTQTIDKLSEKLETIVAYDKVSGEQIGGISQFVNPNICFHEVGNKTVEVVFIPADRGYYYEYFTVDIEAYE